MNNNWLDIDVLEDYLDGKLDAKGMHFVERQELDDPFVAEALEGLRKSPKRKQTFSILQKQLYDRVNAKPIKRKMWGITTQRLSIAATATVAFIAVSILFFMRETNRKNAETAARKANGIEVRLDTNTAVAKVVPKQEDTSNQTVSASALVDQAIVEAKTSDLAKNTKEVPKQESIEVPIAQKVEYAPLSNAREEIISASREATLAKASQKSTKLRKYSEATADASNSEIQAESAIAAAPTMAMNRSVFSGNVLDQSSGKPIQGAVVRQAGSANVTATDAKGYFALPIDSNAKDKDLIVNAVGFKEMPVVADPNAIRSAMSGNKSLNEIAVIMGSNGRKKENIPAPKILLRAEQNLDGKTVGEATKPIPVSTIDYKQYLENNNKLYNTKGPEQFVILGFKIKKNGRPTNIIVIKSLNKKADAEAKRLIESGPDWVLPKNGVDTVEMSVKF